MSISRRQFFHGLTRHEKDPQQDYQRRVRSVENHVLTNLLPYDFALTADQTAEALGAAVDGIDIPTEGELLTPEKLERLREIVEQKVERWREEYLKAEEARQEAIPFVGEFLSQAQPEDLDRLKLRLSTSNSAASAEEFMGEVERHIRVWLSSLANSQLAVFEPAELRELVFSELRSWC